MKRRSKLMLVALLFTAGLCGMLWLGPGDLDPDPADVRTTARGEVQRDDAAAITDTVQTLSARKDAPPDRRQRVSAEAITDLTFKAALDNRPALPAESTLLQAGMINADSARRIFDKRSFDLLADAIDKDMRSDPFSLEIAGMFEGALADSFAAAGFTVDRVACGRAVCVGSAIPESSDASWNAATAAFDRMYGATYSSLVSSYRYVNGQLVHDFMISTNPAQPSVLFPRMPAAGIHFGPAPEAPPAPGG